MNARRLFTQICVVFVLIVAAAGIILAAQYSWNYTGSHENVTVTGSYYYDNADGTRHYGNYCYKDGTVMDGGNVCYTDTTTAPFTPQERIGQVVGVVLSGLLAAAVFIGLILWLASIKPPRRSLQGRPLARITTG